MKFLHVIKQWWKDMWAEYDRQFDELRKDPNAFKAYMDYIRNRNKF